VPNSGEVTDTGFEAAECDGDLLEWETVRDVVRSHWALIYVVRDESLKHYHLGGSKDELSLGY